jgi:hypothetical protein
MTRHVTPEAFDTIVSTTSKKERLWGRPAIARALGVSEDTVSSWAKIPGVPIYEPLPGRYLAYRSELEPWLRTKQTGETR